MSALNENVIRLYDKRPEMALAHLKRETGLDFDQTPQNLVNIEQHSSPVPSRFANYDNDLPVLTDIVALPVFAK
ncbi:hypothetical protein [Reinekea sp.]|uniref:hypothetical protein n=1 Tax=Reinekea sp. TaxID=1970455 RepID=UPI002A8253AC|nr:hypothetical protein [Reinekea sp.]